MSSCPACGVANEPDANFCGECGEFLDWNEPGTASVSAGSRATGTGGRTAPPVARDQDAPASDGEQGAEEPSASVDSPERVEREDHERARRDADEAERKAARVAAESTEALARAEAIAQEAEAERRAAEDRVRTEAAAMEELEGRERELEERRKRAERELERRRAAEETAALERERAAREEIEQAATRTSEHKAAAEAEHARAGAAAEAAEAARQQATEAEQQRASAEARLAEEREALEAIAKEIAAAEAARQEAERRAREEAQLAAQAAKAAEVAESSRQEAEEARRQREEEAAKARQLAQLVASQAQARTPVDEDAGEVQSAGVNTPTNVVRKRTGERLVDPTIKGLDDGPTKGEDEPEIPWEQYKPGDVVCDNCRKGNPPTRSFCKRCGHQLADAPEVTRAPWWRRVLTREDAVYVAGERLPRHGRRTPGDTGTRKLPPLKRLRELLRKGQGSFARFTKLLALLAFFGVGLGITIGPWRATAKGWVEDRFDDVMGFLRPQYEVITALDAEASSAMEGHPAGHAVDLLSNTWWAEGGDGPGIGERLFVIFAEPVSIDVIAITPGAADAEQFIANPRPRLLHVVFDNGVTADLRIEDVHEFQTFDISGAIDVTRVEFQVIEVWQGQSGESMAITEIEFRTRS